MLRRAAVCLCLLFAAASAGQAQEVLYGADGAGGNLSNLYILNPSNGAIVQTVGPIGFSVTGLEVDPTTGILYGTTGREAGPSQGSLITINKTTGLGTLVGDLRIGSTETAADIDFHRDGTLFGWLVPTSEDLVTINLTTGAATIVGNSGLSGTFGGALAGADNVVGLAGFGDNGCVVLINTSTGAVDNPCLFTLNGTTRQPLPACDFNSAGTLFCVRRGADLITIDTNNGNITVRGPTVDNLDAITFDPTQVPALPTAALALTALLLLGAGTWWLTRAPRTV